MIGVTVSKFNQAISFNIYNLLLQIKLNCTSKFGIFLIKHVERFSTLWFLVLFSTNAPK